MKKSVFCLSLLLLSLTACGPAVWSPFPEADFVSYLPYTTGDKITFESDGETMVWEVTDTEYSYYENNNPNIDAIPEVVNFSVNVKNGSHEGKIEINATYRENLSASIDIYEGAYFESDWIYFAEYSSEVKKRKDFKTLLVNTLQLAGVDTDDKAIIEKNKGVTQFETNGKVWKLVELK